MAIYSLKRSYIFSCIILPACEEVHFSYILNKLWSRGLKAEAISSLKENPLFLFCCVCCKTAISQQKYAFHFKFIKLHPKQSSGKTLWPFLTYNYTEKQAVSSKQFSPNWSLVSQRCILLVFCSCRNCQEYNLFLLFSKISVIVSFHWSAIEVSSTCVIRTCFVH